VTDNEQFWRAIVTGDAGVMRRERRRHRRIPGAPRCKTCLVPLGGPAAPVVRLVLKRRPSAKNPNYCDVCETFVRTHPGGAEVEISMLFADVRGSTTLAEQMRPTEFSRLMNRFFDCANRVVIDSDGLVDKLVGDEVVAFYVPAVGPDHARKAVDPQATYCARRPTLFRSGAASTRASRTSARSALTRRSPTSPHSATQSTSRRDSPRSRARVRRSSATRPAPRRASISASSSRASSS
jgi:hypothetical protein